MKRGTYDDLHDHVRDAVLRIAPRKVRTEEDDDADGVEQARVEDDAHHAGQSMWVDCRTGRFGLDTPDPPNNERYRCRDRKRKER